MAVLPPPTTATLSPISGFWPRATLCRKSMPPMTPSNSSPGQPTGMLDQAPMARTTASYLDLNSSKEASTPMR